MCIGALPQHMRRFRTGGRDTRPNPFSPAPCGHQFVNTGMFGWKSSFVPLTGATGTGDDVRVRFDRAQVEDAPNVDEGQALSQDEEHQLYSHSGLDYGDSPSGSGLPEGANGSAGEAGGPGRDTSGPTPTRR